MWLLIRFRKKAKRQTMKLKKLYEEGCAPKAAPVLPKAMSPPRDFRETIADQIEADIKLPQRLPIYLPKQEKLDEEKVEVKVKKEKKKRKKEKKSKKAESSETSSSEDDSDERASKKRKKHDKKSKTKKHDKSDREKRHKGEKKARSRHRSSSEDE
ncbi:hypothetical protein NQ318_017519 [Aromia moschata]|uniref:Uncharacterized protein n=1 Tax=Aromia moschata TaxID=1265417 RepID=A0AAV8Z3A4_9CUCU|nr:hypothetical protein NQ318_017519 [Aromia moschata]